MCDLGALVGGNSMSALGLLNSPTMKMLGLEHCGDSPSAGIDLPKSLVQRKGCLDQGRKLRGSQRVAAKALWERKGLAIVRREEKGDLSDQVESKMRTGIRSGGDI